MSGVHTISRRTRYVVVGAYALYVLVASVVVPVGPAMGTRGPLGIVGFDLWLHTVTYATLGAVLAWASERRTVTGLALVVVIAGLYGGSIELLQSALAHRSFSLADAGANLVGASLGVCGWWGLHRWRRQSMA